MLSGRDSCEDEVVAQLHELLSHRLAHPENGSEAFFNATQNARIVRAAERYYRIMYRGSTESWNLRDRHMFDTLQYVMQRRGPDAKAVVWAHNSHIGNAAATSMGWTGEFNIGELARNAHGDEAILIGFGTDRGKVAAASDWGGEMEIKSVRPARKDSYEHLFRRTGLARSLTDWRPPGRSELPAGSQERRRPESPGHRHRIRCGEDRFGRVYRDGAPVRDPHEWRLRPRDRGHAAHAQRCGLPRRT